MRHNLLLDRQETFRPGNPNEIEDILDLSIHHYKIERELDIRTFSSLSICPDDQHTQL